MSFTGNPWRNRIVSSDTVSAASLTPNPKNWRKHPKRQRQALAGALGEIGWVQNVIVNRTTGRIVDGHARVELAATRGEQVPVLYVELSEAEERIVLASLDPLGTMAETNQAALSELIECANGTSELLKSLVADSAPIDLPPPPAEVSDNQARIAEIKEQRKKGNEGTESKNDTERYLVIVFASRKDREAILKRLGLPEDERYVAAESVDLRAAGAFGVRPAKFTDGHERKAANPRKSGAGG